MPIVVKNKSEKARFALVGVVNTALDFTILFSLHAAGFSSLVANFISTSTAFAFSFVANRHFTFRVRSGNARRQFTLFIIITLTGLWVIQPAIIWFVELTLASLMIEEWVSLLGAKLLATLASLTWNYILYSRVVFPKSLRH